jgi:hypothetical protein
VLPAGSDPLRSVKSVMGCARDRLSLGTGVVSVPETEVCPAASSVSGILLAGTDTASALGA